MFEVIERLKIIQEKYGDSKFIEHCNLKGFIFILDNENIESYKINPKDTSGINADTLNEIKSYMFYEGVIDTNKAVVIPDKKVLSVTPFALIMNYKNYKDKDFESFITKHFSILKERYMDYLNVDEVKNVFMNSYEEISNKLKENNAKDDDKISIFTRKDIEEYKREYRIYLSKKIFLKEKYTEILNGELVGVSSFSLNLDEKKKTLSTNPYGKCNILFGFEEAILLNIIPKIKRSLLDIINDETLGFETKIGIGLEVNKSTKVTKVTNYDLKEIKPENKKQQYKEFNIVASKFTSDKPIKYEISKSELLDKIDKSISEILYFSLNNQESKGKKINTSFLLKNTINKNIDDIKSQLSVFNNNQFISLFIGNKNTFNLFFNKNEDIDISRDIEKLLWFIYNYSFVKSANHYKFDEFLDNMFSILDYLKIKGGHDVMVKKIKDIWDKIVSFKQDDNEFEILDDIEFFFIGGQLIKWLTLNSRANSLNGSLLSDALNIKNEKELKNLLSDKYTKYGYELSLNDKFFNALYGRVMGYKIDENVKLNDKLKYVYQAGLVGDNIRFIRKNKDEIKEAI